MNKNTCVIYAPVDCYSGYSANSRDKAKAIIELKKEEWDIKIISCRWGSTPMNFLTENEEWSWMKEYILNGPLNYQPDYMFWITIPNEAQAIGKYNCLITAGIETTACAAGWLEGCNRMDLNIVSSKHSKDVFLNTKYQTKNEQTQQPQGEIKLEKNVEVIFEGADLNTYKPLSEGFTNKQLFDKINKIPEDFLFIFVGHWIGQELVIGEDRKNVALLIKAFYEIFKNKKNPPALILKTSMAGSSYMDRREILKKIDAIKKTVPSSILPKVYLIHGDFSDAEMNEIYNHPKIKSMVCLTKGEGFGRPLLEFSLVNKPIIASGWSGHVDFLNPEFTGLLKGELKPIHPSAQVPDMLIEGSHWFSPDHTHMGQMIIDVYENYKEWQIKAKRQGYLSRTNFSYEKMKEKMKEVFDKNIPVLPKKIELVLPKLKKIELPKKPELK